ncbi:phage/plasmid replication domain-containing protein [Aegicerativicinus sediminis]|uniref:phage/plasmid replication domain-containing protein n=1 Tax=Aegicerativicinus sediminis TaxID=2893202 RepID=UPI00293BD49B|nr:phage/plasmid replication protein [Aegicerativicinus sediminis]
MIDSLTFTVHNCNALRKRKPSENEEDYQKNPYLNPTAHNLYLALKEYENQYIERKVELLDVSRYANKRVLDALGKSVRKVSFVKSPKVLLVSKGEETLYTKNTFGKWNILSSNYNVVFNVRSSQQEIDFQLSFPKYLYGHSVAQFVPHNDSARFIQNATRIVSPRVQAEMLFERARDFIEIFLRDMGYAFGIVVNVDFKQISLKTMDLCFNQYHHTKQQALSLIECQKKMFNKRLRKDNKTNKAEETALYYRNSARTWYFKIYHKGSEFNKVGKSDFKRLMAVNKDYFDYVYNDPENPKDSMRFRKELESLRELLPVDSMYKGIEEFFGIYKASACAYINTQFVLEFEKLMPYQVYFLLTEADKIVRYEMQFSSTYLSSLYKRNVFCKDSRDWKHLKSRHSKVQQYYNHINKGRNDKAKQYKRKHNITAQCINEYQAVHNFLNSTNDFFFDTDSSVKHLEEYFSIKDRVYKDRMAHGYRIQCEKTATLSPELFMTAYGTFFEEINYYKVEGISNPMTLMEKIDKYNNNTYKRKQVFIQANGQDAYRNLTRAKKMNLDMIEFNRSRLQTYLEALDEGYSLDQIRSQYNIQRSAFYDLKKILKKFSLNEQKIKSQYDFTTARLDYFTYYRLLSNGAYARKLFAPNEAGTRIDSHLFKLSTELRNSA